MIRPRLLIFILLILVLCAVVLDCRTVDNRKVEKKVNINVEKQVAALKDYNEEFIIKPGQVMLLTFPYHGPFNNESLICMGQPIPFAATASQNRAYAYLAQSYFATEGDYACEFQFSDDDAEELITLNIGHMHVSKFVYPRERLRVEQGKVVLSKQDKIKVAQENKTLNEIFSSSSSSRLFDEAFTTPLNSKVTSVFGTKRVFNGNVSTQHLGTDYRAKMGTEIYAANSGRVVFTGSLFYGGNTVIIDHGLGIFSCYSHLSKILVAVGDAATKKTLLGLSGRTGRVNGPHLHWGVNVQGNWVDGLSLINASLRNFSPDTVDDRTIGQSGNK